MATPQRKLHSLEGIVAAFALFFVLALTIGFAQAESQKVVFLRSSAVMVQDAATGEVVLNKNSDAVVPIASITKLVTAMVILDRGLDLEQRIVVSREDVDTGQGNPLAPHAGQHPHARRVAPARAHGFRKPRRGRAGPHLPRRRYRRS